MNKNPWLCYTILYKIMNVSSVPLCKALLYIDYDYEITVLYEFEIIFHKFLTPLLYTPVRITQHKHWFHQLSPYSNAYHLYS